jgi:signal transduction histidine kinase
MLRRALCVSQAGTACAKVTRAMVEAGLEVEHVAAVPESSDAVVVVVDREARQVDGEALRRLAAPIVVVGDDLDDDGLLALMLGSTVSHVVRDAGHPDLAITSEKLASGDLFGLEKYVTRGVAVEERVVGDEIAKRRAVHEVCAWAEGVGARRPLLHRIQSTVDELLMNALRVAAGETTASLRWATDGKVIAVSVGDTCGGLCQRDVIDHLRRARHERGRPNPLPADGAGLGLYLVAANVSALIVNVVPQRRTEVVCIFDLPAFGGVRSLHVFAASST